MTEEIRRRGKELTSRYPHELISKTKVHAQTAPPVQATVKKLPEPKKR